MKIVDSHSHLNFSQFNDDRAEVIARMHAQDIGTITVGTNLQTSQEAVALAKDTPNMWASVGVHPVSVNEGTKDTPTTNGVSPTESSADFPKDEFKQLAQEDVMVAVGECGLDYFRLQNDDFRLKKEQEKLFREHIKLAQEVNLPLILHCRSAHDDVLEMLTQHDNLSGTVHFFTGTLAQAERYIEMGFYIGFDGPITFTTEYDTLIKELPLERMLVETDAPYAAPAPYRGKRNEPAYVVEIAKKIAEVKGVSTEEVAQQTAQNTRALFDL